MNRARVLLVDDHGLVRAGLCALLKELPRIEVVGEANSGAEAMDLIAQLHPDIVLMDVSMPGLNGLEATRRALKEHPRTRVLILSMHADREYVRQALLAGAAGYLLKSAERGELEMALDAVARGEVWLSPAISKAVVDALVRGPTTPDGHGAPVDALTARQREVLQLIAEGHSTKQIAQRLRISAKTVDAHRAEIMSRLDIHHVAGLVHYAIRERIVRPEE